MDVNEHEVAKCDRKFVRELRCEGSCLQNRGLTVLLISLTADSDDHSFFPLQI